MGRMPRALRPTTTRGNNMKLFVTLLAALFTTLALADNHRPNSKYYGLSLYRAGPGRRGRGNG